MGARGWTPQSLGGEGPAYAKQTRVTPYFACSELALRPFRKYLVEGVIGVVDREFEKIWMADTAREPKQAGFGLLLHMANFPELQNKMYLPCEGAFQQEVDALCGAIASVLNNLPANEQQLIEAFGRGELHNIPLNAFSGYSHRKKFLAFVEFVGRLGAHGS